MKLVTGQIDCIGETVQVDAQGYLLVNLEEVANLGASGWELHIQNLTKTQRFGLFVAVLKDLLRKNG